MPSLFVRIATRAVARDAANCVLDLDVTLSNPYYRTPVDIYIGITLPSGTEHWFLAEIVVHKTTFTKSFTMHFDLYDTAYESGWYNASAVGFALGEQFSYMHTVTFDPPLERPGGDPTGVYTIYY